MMAHGSWLMAQGSWLMAKGGRPGLGARGRGSPDPDLAGAAPPRLEEKGPKTVALREKILCCFGVSLFDHLAVKHPALETHEIP